MFIDASVIVAILNEDADAARLVERIEDVAGTKLVSPVVRFEAITSLARSRSKPSRKPSAEDLEIAKRAVSSLLEAIGVSDVTITPTIGDRALQAAQTYGRIVGHKAALNLGDCFAYACAKAYNSPLLYKGADFDRTDLA